MGEVIDFKTRELSEQEKENEIIYAQLPEGATVIGCIPPNDFTVGDFGFLLVVNDKTMKMQVYAVSNDLRPILVDSNYAHLKFIEGEPPLT